MNWVTDNVERPIAQQTEQSQIHRGLWGQQHKIQRPSHDPWGCVRTPTLKRAAAAAAARYIDCVDTYDCLENYSMGVLVPWKKVTSLKKVKV